MRLIHIFWSLLALAVLILLPILLFWHRGKLNGGPEIFATFLLFWWLVDGLTPIVLILAWIKKRPIRHQFLFTFLAVLNLFFGLRGVFYFLLARNILEFRISFLLFLLNLTWSVIIIYSQIRSHQVDSSSV
jgi:hypothetical protein